jgi:hypothetical protein
MAEGVIIVGRLRKRCKIGGLGDGQLVDRLVEIGQRSPGDAVGVQAKEDLVEVEFEDFGPSNRPARCGRPTALL